MTETEMELKRIEIELGEWKEELGSNFPSFLNHVLVSRLMKAEDEIKYLRKVESSRAYGGAL